MSELGEKLRDELLDDKEYAHAYVEEFMNAYIATQIKVLREKSGWTQRELADESGMKQARISLLENVDYDAWSVSTLRKLARAFDLVLKVSFEEFSEAIRSVEGFGREALDRKSRTDDLSSTVSEQATTELAIGTADGDNDYRAIADVYPAAERVKIDMPWKDAVKTALEKKRPPGGWPKPPDTKHR